MGSCSVRAYAIIEPLPNINKDTSLIPQVAHFVHEDHSSTSFKVIPERSPATCSQRNSLGHTANACPEYIITLLNKAAATSSNPGIPDSMDEEADGINFWTHPQ